MAEKLSIPKPQSINPATPINALPDDQDKLHATLESRIFNIVGKELLENDYKPSSYAEAVMQSAGDEHQVMYNYAKIRYKELYTTATRRLKHTSELKS